MDFPHILKQAWNNLSLPSPCSLLAYSWNAAYHFVICRYYFLELMFHSSIMNPRFAILETAKMKTCIIDHNSFVYVL